MAHDKEIDANHADHLQNVHEQLRRGLAREHAAADAESKVLLGMQRGDVDVNCRLGLPLAVEVRALVQAQAGLLNVPL